ncbi:MAG: hypothetical protein JWP25_4941 [Bradyrhizobium sp.]|nr:hypothetical protein [Bradyrhizobium sp.]
MIKDIVVNLEHRIARDPARDFAISIAELTRMSPELRSPIRQSFPVM